ncbi:hypothetical protein [Fictibacillus enclensis]|uniref:hypothetical protein n=1 Tax=Fictibacillus enclensis TaxID=1017270 RepID=UPI0025A2B517|nr:hypothetical protein [Fictibacillus enclensis]
MSKQKRTHLNNIKYREKLLCFSVLLRREDICQKNPEKEALALLLITSVPLNDPQNDPQNVDVLLVHQVSFLNVKRRKKTATVAKIDFMLA